MEYLKKKVFDKFQNPSVVYRLIEFAIKPNLTIEEHVVIYQKSYTREPADSTTGDVQENRVTEFTDRGFEVVSGANFQTEIAGKTLTNVPSKKPAKKAPKKSIKKAVEKGAKKSVKKARKK